MCYDGEGTVYNIQFQLVHMTQEKLILTEVVAEKAIIILLYNQPVLKYNNGHPDTLNVYGTAFSFFVLLVYSA